MVHLRRSILSFTLLFAVLSFGQNIKKHVWKQRVLVILTTDTQHPTYKKQCEVLKKDLEGLTERKLVMYHATPKAYASGTEKLTWKPTTKFYETYKKTDTPFEILLIGLDGGIKLRQSKLLTLKDLYGRIDAMPMRRSELKKY